MYMSTIPVLSRHRGTRSSGTGARTPAHSAKPSAPRTTMITFTKVLSRCHKRTRRISRAFNSSNRATMRPITFVLMLAFTTGPAAAQSWKEYVYPADAFSVAFPADPKIETTTYQAVDGRPVPARVYSASQDGGVFKMTVVDLPDPAMQESVVLDYAVRMLS